jgi:acetoin utilization deacetylase AcuC-like enzyme
MIIYSLYFFSHDVSVIRAFRPDIILLSAGFDAAAKVQRNYPSHVIPHTSHFTLDT